MTQSRRMSIVETVTSTAVGFGVSWAATMIVLPWFGFPVKPGAAFSITVIYTVLSLARGYALRRIFNHWSRAA